MLASRLAAAALLFSVTPAMANVASDLAAVDKAREACIGKDSSTAGMAGCNSTALDAADKILNRVYKAATEGLKRGGPGGGPDDKEILRRLVASERAWVAYKSAECELQGTAMLGGSGEGLVVADCVYTMTKARAKSLDDLLSQK